MASVASCFEIAGHQATDALAEEIFAADHLGRLTLSAEWRIVIDREYAKKREKREFMVALMYDGGAAVATHSRFVYYMSKRFPVTKQGYRHVPPSARVSAGSTARALRLRGRAAP